MLSCGVSTNGSSSNNDTSNTSRNSICHNINGNENPQMSSILLGDTMVPNTE